MFYIWWKSNDMTTTFLFPSKFKAIGWILFSTSILALCIFLATSYSIDSSLNASVFAIVETPLFGEPTYFTIIQNSILDEILLVTIIIGGILVGFSQTPDEDEYISKIRFESLIWAMYFNFALMLLATIFFYGFIYFYILSANVFSMLLFFIIRFHIKLYQLKNLGYDE